MIFGAGYYGKNIRIFRWEEEERNVIYIIISMQHYNGREEVIRQLTEKGWKLGDDFQVYDVFQKQMIYDYLEAVL